MPRSIWKGAISFSLIHIPVSLHTASRPNELDLDLLDRRDFSPVGYQRINKKTGKLSLTRRDARSRGRDAPRVSRTATTS